MQTCWLYGAFSAQEYVIYVSPKISTLQDALIAASFVANPHTAHFLHLDLPWDKFRVL